MTHSRLLEQVRVAVLKAFGEVHFADNEPCETILVRNGHYCGRRFTVHDGSAIWFVEENQIKVYDARGALLTVTAPSEAPREVALPRAA